MGFSFYGPGSGTGGGGSSGDRKAVTAAAITVDQALGGYNVGDIIPKGTDYETIFRKIFEMNQAPTLIPPFLHLEAINISLLGNPGAFVTKNVGLNRKLVKITPLMEFGFEAKVMCNRGEIYPQFGAASPYRSGVFTRAIWSASDSKNMYLGGKSVVQNITMNESQQSVIITSPAEIKMLFNEATDMHKYYGEELYLNVSAQYEGGAQPQMEEGQNYSTPLTAGTVSLNQFCVVEFTNYIRANDQRKDVMRDIELVSKTEGEYVINFGIPVDGTYPETIELPPHLNITGIYTWNDFTQDWQEAYFARPNSPRWTIEKLPDKIVIKDTLGRNHMGVKTKITWN